MCMRAACMQESSQLGVLQQVRFRYRLHLHLDVESERLGGSACEGRAVVDIVDCHVASVPAVPEGILEEESVRTRGEAPRVRIRLVVAQRSRGDCDAIDLEADLFRPHLCGQLHRNSYTGRRRRGRRIARLLPDLLLDATIAAAAVRIADVFFASHIRGPIRAVEVAIITITVGPLGAVIFGLVDALPDPPKNACSASVLSVHRGKQDA